VEIIKEPAGLTQPQNPVSETSEEELYESLIETHNKPEIYEVEEEVPELPHVADDDDDDFITRKPGAPKSDT